MKNPPPIFHALTRKFSGLTSRIITPIIIASPFDPANPPDPLPKHYETIGLWDTGATNSVITTETVTSLGLIPVGTVQMNHAGGSSLFNTYLVNFLLPNNVGIAGVRVIECPKIVENIGAIIGMDIIRLGDFAITNVNGQTWMSYRIPSVEHIDYVSQAEQLTKKELSKTPRNAPCPCGKKDLQGKPIKFKKCHGKNF